MKPFNETDHLVVGKYYNVRCAKLKMDWDEVLFIPIIGEKHKDPQFSVEHEHYHIDGRFANLGSGYKYTVDQNGKTNGIVIVGKYFETEFIEVVVRRMRCKRLTTGIRPPDHALKYWTWHDSMIGKSCKGRKCPHLGTLMAEQDGVLVCPLHNLHGSIESETIIEIPR
ncbi:hypothetical protein [Dyadobacter alkalitolerans]|uniref:hypothetical protein n=1 Tax=Dyadobacter alkalitolerans TaxID=492736 RepID=UPI00040C8015|nr:hypothetical protein [Dyadobacter alkalitolerans]